MKRLLAVITALMLVGSLLAVTASSASAQTDWGTNAQTSASIMTRCVAGTAPAGMTPPGTCSSPFDPPPNLAQKCSFELVKIAAQIWVPGVFVRVYKVLRYVQKLIGGITIPVAVWGWGQDWIEGNFRAGYNWVERWVCRNG